MRPKEIKQVIRPVCEYLRKRVGVDNERTHIRPGLLNRSPGYYIVRRRPPGAGFFSNYFYVLGHVLEGLGRGLLPVVDMQHYRTLYNEKQPVNGTRNAWEYYFDQPHCLQEAYGGGNYILSDTKFRRERMPYWQGPTFCRLNGETSPPFLAAAEKYAPIRPEIKTEVEEFHACHLAGHKVLGVHYRGTDKKIRQDDHSVTSPPAKYLAAIRNLVLERGYDLVFFCTDDATALAMIREKTPCPIATTQAFRDESSSVTGIHHEAANRRRRPLHRYRMGLEVLRDTLLLARCHGLVYSHSNVTNAALVLNQGVYEDTRFIPPLAE